MPIMPNPDEPEPNREKQFKPPRRFDINRPPLSEWEAEHGARSTPPQVLLALVFLFFRISVKITFASSTMAPMILSMPAIRTATSLLTSSGNCETTSLATAVFR